MTGPTPPDPCAPAPAGRGLFVAFEGGDGAGKSTQLASLGDWLERQGYAVHRTREPGGTGLGRQVRELLLHGDDGSVSPRAEALLFAADRAHHVASLVRPALARGEVVLTDRYLDGVPLAAAEHPPAHRAFLAVTHLLEPPAALLHPAVALPALAALARGRPGR